MERHHCMSVPSAVPSPTALVLAGGNALGAFQAGVYEALEESGLQSDWIVGTSIGAVNGALIAGNPEGRRLEALHAFWSMAALKTRSGSHSHSAISVELRRLYAQTLAMLLASYG